MTPAPRRTYQVLHIAQKETMIEEEPDVTAWVKRTKMNTTHPFIVWARGDISELAKLYEDLPSEFNSNSPSCGITFGRAMIKPSVKITTSGRRFLPRYLWRATHGDQPHEGLKSRGQNGAPPQYFAAQFIQHYNWNSRDPSPFMSWADNEYSALRVACSYELREYENVKVHKIDTRGEGWDRQRQRIWRFGALIKAFDYEGLDGPSRESEFLIENSVPEQSLQTSDYLATMAENPEFHSRLKHDVKELWDKRRSAARKKKERYERQKREVVKYKQEKTKLLAEHWDITLEKAVEVWDMMLEARKKKRRRVKDHKRLLQRATA